MSSSALFMAAQNDDALFEEICRIGRLSTLGALKLKFHVSRGFATRFQGETLASSGADAFGAWCAARREPHVQLRLKKTLCELTVDFDTVPGFRPDAEAWGVIMEAVRPFVSRVRDFRAPDAGATLAVLDGLDIARCDAVVQAVLRAIASLPIPRDARGLTDGEEDEIMLRLMGYLSPKKPRRKRRRQCRG
jgi:hypothetical protein